MDKIYSASRYLRNKLLGSSPHGIHSPFVFELMNKVIRDETPYYFYENVESLRSRLLLNEQILEVLDWGTGGTENNKRELKVSFIAKHFLQSKRNAQLLSRLVSHFKPKTILELGTSLGITSLYLALPSQQSQLITLEGCPATARLARENFQFMGVRNIELLIGEFDTNLSGALNKFNTLDFVYFDGNHRGDATLKYFESCVPKHDEDSVFIFDDIHWSRDMSKAWLEIKKHPDVTVTLDLYHFGLVFFRKGIPCQHFNLKY